MLDALATIVCSDDFCNSGLLGVLLGNGDGTFQPEQTYYADYPPTSLAIADLNGDGKADALVTLCRERLQNCLLKVFDRQRKSGF